MKLDVALYERTSINRACINLLNSALIYGFLFNLSRTKSVYLKINLFKLFLMIWKSSSIINQAFEHKFVLNSFLH